MLDQHKIPFWNNKYIFDAIGFSEKIANLWEEYEDSEHSFDFDDDSMQRQAEEFRKQQVERPQQEIEDGNNEVYYSAFAQIDDPEQLQLAVLSSRQTIMPDTEKKIGKLWQNLEEQNKKLIFTTSKLREIAEKKIGLITSYIDEKPVEFFGFGYPEKVEDQLLLKYLENDLQLLRSSLVIEYIKYKQFLTDSKFLKKLNLLICPKGLSRGNPRQKPPRFVLDWIFTQVFYYRNILHCNHSILNLARMIAPKTKDVIGRSLGKDAIRSYYKKMENEYLQHASMSKERAEYLSSKINKIVSECVTEIV